MEESDKGGGEGIGTDNKQERGLKSRERPKERKCFRTGKDRGRDGRICTEGHSDQMVWK